MDIRKCDACRIEFDFDISGLQGPDNVVVCGQDCAKKISAKRGNRIVIHDNTGKIVETDVQLTDVIGKHLF